MSPKSVTLIDKTNPSDEASPISVTSPDKNILLDINIHPDELFPTWTNLSKRTHIPGDKFPVSPTLPDTNYTSHELFPMSVTFSDKYNNPDDETLPMSVILSNKCTNNISNVVFPMSAPLSGTTNTPDKEFHILVTSNTENNSSDFKDVRDLDYEPSDFDQEESDDALKLQHVDHEEVVQFQTTISHKRKAINKRSQNKKLRMQGKPYLGLKKTGSGKSELCAEKSGRILTERSCTKRCEKGWGGQKCNIIDEETRAEIFKLFWESMTWGEKKVYVKSLVEKKVTKRNTSKSASRRKFSYDFFLKKNNVKVKVCQSLFLSTFGLRNETIYRWIGEGNEDHGISKSPSTRETCRGHNTKEEAKEAAEYFLRSIPKMPSHYCCAQMRKLYLETTHISLRELYSDYKINVRWKKNHRRFMVHVFPNLQDFLTK